MGSIVSSENEGPTCRRCGNPIEWVDYTGDPGWSHSRGAKKPCGDPRPMLRCTCGHVVDLHGHGRTVGECHGFGCECSDFRCDHTRCGWKPREEKPVELIHKWKRCKCGHPNHASRCECGCLSVTSLGRLAQICRLAGGCPEHPVIDLDTKPREECQHPNKYATGARYSAADGEIFYRCPDCKAKWSEPWEKPREEEPMPRCGGCGYHHLPGNHTCGYATDEAECCACRGRLEAEPPSTDCHSGLPMACTCPPEECVCDSPEEPPLTPEEEEQAPPDENACQDCLRGAHGPNAHRAEPPPQPDRRPPYAVAYSVQGHLYEVALPGDAAVQAVDGALVIQHDMAPVAGIVQIRPLSSKESNA